jgi:ribosomal protein S18 acetylase RimI-like enzyme
MSRESILYEMSAPDYIPALYPILVTESGTAIGYAHATLVDEGGTKSGKIHTIAVHPEYQGRGLGKLLLCYCASTLKSMGATTITLCVESDNPTNAIPLYRSIGFEPFKEWLGYSLTIGVRDGTNLLEGGKSSRKD